MPDDSVIYVFVSVIFFVVVVLFARSMRAIPPYEMGVVTLLGAYRGVLNPGFSLVSPLAKVIRVDLRSQRVTVAPTEYGAPGGTLRLSLTLDFRVIDPAKAVFQVKDLQGLLGDALRKGALDFLATSSDLPPGPSDLRISQAVTSSLEISSERFGIKVEAVIVQRVAQVR